MAYQFEYYTKRSLAPVCKQANDTINLLKAKFLEKVLENQVLAYTQIPPESELLERALASKTKNLY
jgi:hypothetical protein